MTTITFQFGSAQTAFCVRETVPGLETITGGRAAGALIVCDENTRAAAGKIRAGYSAALCVLPPGETAKTWRSVEAILKAASDAGLDRDGFFIGCGGGAVTDLTAFAASVYRRGAALCLVSTTLLGMADASLGGKTGIGLFGVKNLAGTFYPASRVYAPVRELATLPEREWKSGMAEVIKTALLDESGALAGILAEHRAALGSPGAAADGKTAGVMGELVLRAAELKGRIVEKDPLETGSRRLLLNLGHTFGHALEAARGLGTLTHGEAVAWGIARAAELGRAAGITSENRKREITELLASWGYETGFRADPALFFAALAGDKKRKSGRNIFIVPTERSAETLSLDMTLPTERNLIEKIIMGA
ncbi:MAG: 3-dehydroquinate synthase [Spirochaetaceae bacterium]|nr:3-dehydroquinate synthase [Spirochaetaceae bacterium]